MRFAWAAAAVLGIAGIGCTWPGTLEVYVPEIGGEATHRLDVGRDLGLLVALRIPIDPERGEYRHPDSLDFDPDDEAGVTIEDLGKIGFGDDAWATVGRDGEGKLLRITPRRTGLGTIRFTADDAENTAELDWNAWDVQRVDYLVRIHEGGLDRTERAIDHLSVFAGSGVELRAQYRVEAIALHGAAPLVVDAADPGTRFLEPSAEAPTAPPDLRLGDTPHTAVVSSPAGGTTLTIAAVDASAIASIRVAADSTTILAPGIAYRAQTGRTLYLSILPFDAEGLFIEGSTDTEPEATLTGDAVELRDLISGPRLMLEARAPGISTVEITWGSASTSVMIEVVDDL